jgi:hypothetical protein
MTLENKIIKLIKEYLEITPDESQRMADEVCWFYSSRVENESISKKPCKYNSICDKSIEELRELIK